MPLLRPAYSIGLIVVKCKRKVACRSHVLFESVRPNVAAGFLIFLKQNNQLYSDIEIDLDNISESLTNFGHTTGNLHEKMINNISEPLDVILINYPSDVTKLITVHILH